MAASSSHLANKLTSADPEKLISNEFPEEAKGNHFTLTAQSRTSWILDIGTIDQICSFLNLFSDYKPIKPLMVKLPNGSNILSLSLALFPLPRYFFY